MRRQLLGRAEPAQARSAAAGAATAGSRRAIDGRGAGARGPRAATRVDLAHARDVIRTDVQRVASRAASPASRAILM